MADLSGTYGPMLIGSFLSCALWGMTSLQGFLYFYRYGSDRLGQKILVAFLWTVDTVNQILLLESLWPVLISKWGVAEALSEVPVGIIQHIWISGIVAVGVQSFYLYRIYLFSGRKWLFPAIIASASLYQIIQSIPFNILLNRNFTMAEVYSHPIMALNTSLRACSAVIDILIAVIMSYYLMKQGIPKIPSSRKMYFRLISLTVSTGIWTAIVATADFCLMAAYQEQLYYTIFEFPLCSLYVSVLLANLNSREFVKGSEEPWQGVSPSRRSISTIPVRGTVGAAEDYPPSQAMMMLDLTPSVDGKFKHDTVDFSPKMASNYLTV